MQRQGTEVNEEIQEHQAHRNTRQDFDPDSRPILRYPFMLLDLSENIQYLLASLPPDETNDTGGSNPPTSMRIEREESGILRWTATGRHGAQGPLPLGQTNLRWSLISEQVPDENTSLLEEQLARRKRWYEEGGDRRFYEYRSRSITDDSAQNEGRSKVRTFLAPAKRALGRLGLGGSNSLGSPTKSTNRVRTMQAHLEAGMQSLWPFCKRTEIK